MTRIISMLLFALSITFSPIGRGGEEHKIGDITLTLEDPGEIIGTFEGGSEEDEKETTYALFCENISIFRSKDALVINDIIYREIQNKHQLIVKSGGRLFIEDKEVQGKVASSSFENRQWSKDEIMVDGITFKIKSFLAGNYCSTLSADLERKEGDKVSHAFGIVTVTTEKGKVSLWGKPIGHAKSSIILNQEARKIFLDGKEVKWPD